MNFLEGTDFEVVFFCWTCLMIYSMSSIQLFYIYVPSPNNVCTVHAIFFYQRGNIFYKINLAKSKFALNIIFFPLKFFIHIWCFPKKHQY